MIGATIGLVVAAEVVAVLGLYVWGPTVVLMLTLAALTGALPRSSGLLPFVSALVGGFLGLRAVTLVSSLAGQEPGWLALVGFATGLAVALEMQPRFRRGLGLD